MSSQPPTRENGSSPTAPQSLRRLARLARRLFLLLAIGLALFWVWCFIFTTNPAEIRAKFARLEPRLTQAWRGSGIFANQLSPDIQRELSAICGRWSYSTADGYYAISFGNYARDGFYMCWNSKEREWLVDE